jgi:pimeloyl-ACP methyl ester carboxylesterase
MKRWLTIAALLTSAASAYLYFTLPIFRDPLPGSDQVVVLHGLGRSESAMLLLENELAGAGFEVHNIGYPSNDQPPDALIDLVSRAVEACCANNGRTMHLVGHSLGGLLIRAYLQQGHPDNLGNVVLLGTPNRGSELADLSDGLPGTVLELAGPTARLLGTGPDDFPASLAPPDYPVGVIAGTRDALVTNEWLPLPNDGMVSLESARLKGMTDFKSFDVTHWGLRNNREVAAAVVQFLRTRQF